GPFYCPGDRKVYLDTDFFRVMQRQMGAGGDFAYAYVIAHEIGHHVQNLLGVLPQVNRARAQAGPADSNRLSVLTELQADCFAGIWARHAADHFGSIEPGDVDEAVNAARAVGDDILMEKSGRAPMPDSFTHGSAADRSAWLSRGMRSGRIADCDSFAGAGRGRPTASARGAGGGGGPAWPSREPSPSTRSCPAPPPAPRRPPPATPARPRAGCAPSGPRAA